MAMASMEYAPRRAMMDRVDEAARERFGIAALKPWQREAIDAVLGEPGRALVVAPTGGGKSLVYQLPATLLDGTTLVLSPLVALMEDQVRGLQARGIRSTYLASTLDVDERRSREQHLVAGEYDLVYAAPERLANEWFVGVLSRCKVPLIAIDEAHCIVQWGHDFRPDYLRIGALLARFPGARVLACTATATQGTRTEIRARLGLEDRCTEIVRGFARPNLHLEASSVESLKQTERAVRAALARGLSGGGGAIVYTATRRAAEKWTAKIADYKYRAMTYHAGLGAAERSAVSAAFSERSVDVVVATNAFGMGIDRPDVRVVAHVQPPASLPAYYQEVGRAGRDGADAWGLLFCSSGDIAIRRRLIDDGTPEQIARQWALFRELLLYLDARTCRHDFILRYFGDERGVLGGCGHCDACVTLESEPAEAAAPATLIVQKALSGVARTKRRAGLATVADMLRGQSSPRVEKFGFGRLSTFGALGDYDGPGMLALLRALLAAGWIDLTPTDFPVPYVTNEGWAVMKGERPARLVLPRPRAERPAAKAPTTLPPLEAGSLALLAALKAHRACVARRLGYPAYMVAHDRTLVELCQKRPRTVGELLGVHGFGPLRAEQYGDGFLRVIADA